ncbi:hypothetical protein PVAG01_10675 [Phlyctema vagabunda]|uniref:ER membrane protein complex subunit 7 beta-sandwich domain-containing protein n=1 Tax=Phlyctema vagabunda TaxID=108571 RepID=A0ABR4P2W6_9HELO
MRLVSLLTASLLAPLVHSANILVGLPHSSNVAGWNAASEPATTRATLSTLSAEHTALLRSDHTFAFHNVSAGSYLLDVHSSSHLFAPLRVDVTEGDGDLVEVWGTFRGNEWENKGEVVGVRGVAGYKTFEVRVLAEKNYYLERTGFSPLSILKNPMILIAGFSMILVFGMPYLMENMDPELKEEFEARQKTSALTGGPVHANPLQNFDAAAWLAGSKQKTDASETAVTR